MVWIRDEEHDGLRLVLTVVALGSVAWSVAAAVMRDWAWAGFTALIAVGALRSVLSGVLVVDDRAFYVSGFALRQTFLSRIDSVEVGRPAARFVFVRLWVGGRRDTVVPVRRWTSPGRARAFALRLTTHLQEQGCGAGMHDAITGDWPIAPLAAREGSA